MSDLEHSNNNENQVGANSESTTNKSNIKSPRVWVPAVLAVAALGLTVFYFGCQSCASESKEQPAPPIAKAAPAPEKAEPKVVIEKGAVLRAPAEAELPFDIGTNHLVLAPKGEARMMHHNDKTSMLSMQRGKLACSMKWEKGASRLLVKSGRLIIQATDARLLIVNHGTGYNFVGVESGVVDIESFDGMRETLTAGQQLEIKDGVTQKGPIMEIAAKELKEFLD